MADDGPSNDDINQEHEKSSSANDDINQEHEKSSSDEKPKSNLMITGIVSIEFLYNIGLLSKVIGFFKSVKTLFLIIGIVLLAIFLSPIGPGAPIVLLEPKDVAKHITSTYCDRDQFIKSINVKLENAVKNKEDLLEINLAYLSFMHSYVCELPKHNPIVVWGPASETESGLSELVEYWRGQTRIVVEVDLTDFNGNITELNELIQKGVMHAFSKRKLSREILIALDDCILTEKEEMGDIGVKGRFIKIIKSLTKPIIGLFTLLETAIFSTNVVETWYEENVDNFGEYMGSFFRSKEEAITEINFKDFFRAMRLISRIDASLAPIVVISNLENTKAEGKVFVKKLVELLEKFEENQNNIPIIISSPNTLWLKNADIDNDDEKIFQRYELFPLSSEQVNDLLVDKLKIWNTEEIDEITKEIGLRTSPIKEIYRANKLNNIQLTEAISQSQSLVCSNLLEVIGGYSKEDLNSYLLSLPVKVNPGEALGSEKIQYLLSKKVVYLSSFHMLDLVANGMRNSIQNCLAPVVAVPPSDDHEDYECDVCEDEIINDDINKQNNN